MSAFLVSSNHIDVLVHARRVLRHKTFGRIGGDTTDTELGQMLWRENMLSLAARVPTDASVDEVALATYSATAYPPGRFSIVELLKAIHCYEYQSCEHDGWDTSEARAYCRAVERELLGLLPGYESAPWAIE